MKAAVITMMFKMMLIMPWRNEIVGSRRIVVGNGNSPDSGPIMMIVAIPVGTEI